MDDRQLMQQALEALMKYHYYTIDMGHPNHSMLHEGFNAVTALRDRLAHCDRCGKKLGGEGDIHTCTPDPIGDGQDRLIAEIAAQPEQEPVAWMHTMIDDVVIGHRPADLNRHPERWKPLTAPTAAQPAAPAIPIHRIADVELAEIDDMRPGRAYREGWNECRAAMLASAQPAPVPKGWPSDDLVTEKAKQSGFDLSPTPNMLYTVRGNHAQLVNFARAMLPTPPAAAQPDLADEVIGCFNAAECEGLTEALANTTDEHLKDLVERRLMYALYAAQEAKEKNR